MVADQVDIAIGLRVKKRRTALRLTRKQLGKLIGVSYQMVQKYETGENRISVSRLQKIADALDVSTAYFFSAGSGDPSLSAISGLSESPSSRYAGQGGRAPADADGAPENEAGSREAKELFELYFSIPEPGLRQSLLEHMRLLSRQFADAVIFKNKI